MTHQQHYGRRHDPRQDTGSLAEHVNVGQKDDVCGSVAQAPLNDPTLMALHQMGAHLETPAMSYQSPDNLNINSKGDYLSEGSSDETIKPSQPQRRFSFPADEEPYVAGRRPVDGDAAQDFPWDSVGKHVSHSRRSDWPSEPQSSRRRQSISKCETATADESSVCSTVRSTRKHLLTHLLEPSVVTNRDGKRMSVPGLTLWTPIGKERRTADDPPDHVVWTAQSAHQGSEVARRVSEIDSTPEIVATRKDMSGAELARLGEWFCDGIDKDDGTADPLELCKRISRHSMVEESVWFDGESILDHPNNPGGGSGTDTEVGSPKEASETTSELHPHWTPTHNNDQARWQAIRQSEIKLSKLKSKRELSSRSGKRRERYDQQIAGYTDKIEKLWQFAMSGRCSTTDGAGICFRRKPKSDPSCDLCLEWQSIHPEEASRCGLPGCERRSSPLLSANATYRRSRTDPDDFVQIDPLCQGHRLARVKRSKCVSCTEDVAIPTDGEGEIGMLTNNQCLACFKCSDVGLSLPGHASEIEQTIKQLLEGDSDDDDEDDDYLGDIESLVLRTPWCDLWSGRRNGDGSLRDASSGPEHTIENMRKQMSSGRSRSDTR